MGVLVDLDALSPGEIAARLASPEERALLIRAGAEAGLAEAQAVYAQMLLDGDGVQRDATAAFRWFMHAAAQHHLMALNMVGRCYDLGWGVRVDKRRAVKCYRIAAERGLVEGMYNYATLLTLGDGVAEDKPAALAWLERAAAAGYAKAVNFVGSFCEDGWATPRDPARAARCYREAAAGGDFRGAFNHARMLAAEGAHGEAVLWLRRSGEWGNAAFVAKACEWVATHAPEPIRTKGLAALREGAGC